jgi:hypothetical protein
VHGFGLTQKLDSIVLQGIKLTLHISTAVKFKAKAPRGVEEQAVPACLSPPLESHGYYELKTENSRAISIIIKTFSGLFKGMKSLDFKL